METCPCGRGPYAECCGPLHEGRRQAASPGELMRSRYSAFAKGDAFYLARTWHPRTRPDDLALDASTRWSGLTVMAETEAGETGTVDFVARFVTPEGPGALREHSRFVRRAGRWTYLDGDVT